MDIVNEPIASDVPIPRADAPAQTLAERWQAFADFVRANPATLNRPPEELAAEFDLSEDFVRSFLVAMRAPVERVSYLEVAANAVKSTVSRFIFAVRNSLAEITNRPLACLIASTLGGFGLVALIILLRSNLGLGENVFVTGLSGVLIGTVVVGVTLLQINCLYRHAQMRLALITSVLVLLAWFAFFNLMITGESRIEMEQTGIGALAIFALGSLFMAGGYFVMATTAVLVGGYMKYRRESIVEEEVSRQELLDRLFQINTRLESILQTTHQARTRWVDRIRVAKTFYLNVMLWGFALGMLEVLVFGIYNRLTGGNNLVAMQSTWPVIATSISFFILKLGGMTMFGFIAGRPMRSMSAILAFWAGLWIAYLFPLGTFGPMHALGLLTVPRLIGVAFVVMVLGTITGFLALVEERNYRDQMLRNDDPASLMAEQIRIQWRLGLGQQASTVIVVDVARSTSMKANADPLKIEWSFREYQHLVDEICRNNGGQVLSTAGDGAVAAFPNPELAVIASRQILASMAEFNMRRNRLDTPFRLRIGIHAGRTEASLADAPFNEVIDIAAHIEGSAPVGGLAVSRAVVAAVKKLGLAVGELEDQVDGEQVYVVLSPISDS